MPMIRASTRGIYTHYNPPPIPALGLPASLAPALPWHDHIKGHSAGFNGQQGWSRSSRVGQLGLQVCLQSLNTFSEWTTACLLCDGLGISLNSLHLLYRPETIPINKQGHVCYDWWPLFHTVFEVNVSHKPTAKSINMWEVFFFFLISSLLLPPPAIETHWQPTRLCLKNSALSLLWTSKQPRMHTAID